ncbi:hypothetical protein diail_5136 [Diaporthe ilicicola]|nr:hypothetical protein diail_5136 [Diaporthe ilicicola]
MDTNEERRRKKRQTFPGALAPTTKLPNDNVQCPASTLTTSRPSNIHRNSTISVNRMPSIMEDENSMFTNNRRSRIASIGPYYRYGEDYITEWDRVGVAQSPTPRAPSRQSTFSSRATNSGDVPDIEAGLDEKLPRVRDETLVARLGGFEIMPREMSVPSVALSAANSLAPALAVMDPTLREADQQADPLPCKGTMKTIVPPTGSPSKWCNLSGTD